MGRRGLVAVVGGGGKTSALCLLAGELAAAGGRVVVTTTTAMRLRELSAVGPLVMEADDAALIAALSEALKKGRAVGAARAPGADGKVIGLPPATIDRLWADDLADYVLVEADGSRGMPLKAFGLHEPQVPGTTSTIIVVAGLDAIGRPLSAEHVHRADALAATLEVPLGAAVTPRLFVRALREQVRRLRQGWPASRLVALLNKADGRDDEALGCQVARELLASVPDADREPPSADQEGPDAVIVASLRRGRFARVPAAGGALTVSGAITHESAPVAVVAIVLAAGCATRMGSQKVLLELEGRSLVQRVVDAALGSRATKTVVVVGHEAGPVTDALTGRPVVVVVNADHAAGMSTSLQAGVRAAGACDAAIFLLGDQPYVTAALIDQLVAGFAETGKAVVRPLVGARPANPVLLSAALFPEILGQRGDVGGREIVARHPDEICLVPLDDPALVIDIDSPEDYEAAREST